MYKKTLAYHQCQAIGGNEIVICRIINSTGLRIFSDCMPPDVIRLDPLMSIHDGTYTYDGSISYGCDYEDVLDFGARVLKWGELSETLTPDSGDLILSNQSQEITTMQIVFNNADLYFSRLLGRENFISASIEMLIGFMDLSRDYWVEQFTGRISRIVLTSGEMKVTAKAA